jgi:ABC-type lipoprotein export system ATPase subunit
MLRVDAVWQMGSTQLTANWGVAAGAKVAVIGPSGAGKSSLLLGIAGYLAPKSGQVLWNGVNVRAQKSRCASMLSDPKITTMVMGNHGVLVVGQTVAEAFNRLYYFERAAETYIRALQTGQPLRVLPDAVAEKTAQEWEAYPGFAEAHLREIKAMLDESGDGYAS